MTASAAAARPLAGAHSIWEIARHIAVYHVARRRLAGDVAQPPPHEDWPETSRRGLGAHAPAPEADARCAGGGGDGLSDLRLPDLARSSAYYTLYYMLHGSCKARALPRGPDRLL